MSEFLWDSVGSAVPNSQFVPSFPPGSFPTFRPYSFPVLISLIAPTCFVLISAFLRSDLIRSVVPTYGSFRPHACPRSDTRFLPFRKRAHDRSPFGPLVSPSFRSSQFQAIVFVLSNLILKCHMFDRIYQISRQLFQK